MRHMIAVALAVLLLPSATLGQAVEPVLARVKQERAPFIDTLRELVSIDSGSRDIDGLNRISDVIANRLRALGGDVQFVAPANDARFEDTPAQIGRMGAGSLSATPSGGSIPPTPRRRRRSDGQPRPSPQPSDQAAAGLSVR